jgi:hypothetical protein
MHPVCQIVGGYDNPRDGRILKSAASTMGSAGQAEMVDDNQSCGRNAGRMVAGAIIRGVAVPLKFFRATTNSLTARRHFLVRTAFWAPDKPWSIAWERKIGRNRFSAAVEQPE